MKILFSPSEGKNSENSASGMKLLFNRYKREEILNTYNETIARYNVEELKKLFGRKKESDFQEYLVDIFNAPTAKAVARYDGVAYDYLQYAKLSNDAQNYVDTHTIIFSNLFGPLRADDLIPNYKIKQGESVAGIAPDKYYKAAYSNELDTYLENEEILDLRAGYYDKFYKITKPYTTMKFLKDGKTVSHWAKAYRGNVLKALAENKIESIEALLKLKIDHLEVAEMKTTKNRTEIIYNIV